MGRVPPARVNVAADITADVSADPMSYTPVVSLGDGTRAPLSNADLTNAISSPRPPVS
jgi:hypothetical protein